MFCPRFEKKSGSGSNGKFFKDKIGMLLTEKNKEKWLEELGLRNN